MSLLDIGATGEFPDGAARIVAVDGREVGVVRWGCSWFALRNVCPHVGAPLCEGPVQPLLTQESVTSAAPTVDVDRPTIKCPWHHWEFDLESGHSVTGRERTKTYPVHVRDGRVLVDVPRKRARP